ncbi:hypothetical protein ACW73L_10325 [Methylolobus aquaticus]
MGTRTNPDSLDDLPDELFADYGKLDDKEDRAGNLWPSHAFDVETEHDPISSGDR